MVSKESRTKIREKKHRRQRNRFSGTAEDHVWLCSEVIIMCMLRL